MPNRLYSVALIILSIQTASSYSVKRYTTCRTICKDYLDSQTNKSNVCQGAINIMPKPTVHKACMKGKTLGFDHACMSSCTGEINESTNTSQGQGNSFEACQSLKKKSLPNHQFPWCRRGYDDTYSRVKEGISELTEGLFQDFEVIENEYNSEEDNEVEIKEENIKNTIIDAVDNDNVIRIGESSVDQESDTDAELIDRDTEQDEENTRSPSSEYPVIDNEEEIMEELSPTIDGNNEQDREIEPSYDIKNTHEEEKEEEEATFIMHSSNQKMEEERPHDLVSVDTDTDMNFGEEDEEEKEQYGGDIANIDSQNFEDMTPVETSSDSQEMKSEHHPASTSTINEREEKEGSTIDNTIMEETEVFSTDNNNHFQEF